MCNLFSASVVLIVMGVDKCSINRSHGNPRGISSETLALQYQTVFSGRKALGANCRLILSQILSQFFSGRFKTIYWWYIIWSEFHTYKIRLFCCLWINIFYPKHPVSISPVAAQRNVRYTPTFPAPSHSREQQNKGREKRRRKQKNPTT